MNPAFALVLFVAVTLFAGWFGSLFSPGDWYANLHKPPLTPPNAVFGPVWGILYLAIAVAAWRVWRAAADSRRALSLWSLQLFLNALWSLLFFGWQRPGIALIDIVLLLVVVMTTTVAFHRIDRWAGALFVPYLAWVAFASYLNAGIWFLNR